MNIINFLQILEYDGLKKKLKENGYHIIELNTAGLEDIGAIYRKLTKVLPVGIPLSNDVHWDAFQDSAWEGITEQNERQIAFIWLGSDTLLTRKLSQFFVVIDNLKDLAISVNAEGYTMVLYVLGNGEFYS